VISPEDVLVERVLISVYRRPYEPAAACARKMVVVALEGLVELDWREARRLAGLPDYRFLPPLEQLVSEVAHELGKPSPYHS